MCFVLDFRRLYFLFIFMLLEQTQILMYLCGHFIFLLLYINFIFELFKVIFLISPKSSLYFYKKFKIPNMP